MPVKHKLLSFLDVDMREIIPGLCILMNKHKHASLIIQWCWTFLWNFNLYLENQTVDMNVGASGLKENKEYRNHFSPSFFEGRQ